MLLGNYSVLHKLASRFTSGGFAFDRANSNRSGPNRNVFVNADFDKTSGLPTGHNPPSSRILPLTLGGMSAALGQTVVSVKGTASGLRGVTALGTALIELAAAGTGQLITSGSGSASISLDGTGTLVATLTSPGSASISIAASGTMTAKGSMSGQATISIAGSLLAQAVGIMEGEAHLAGEALASPLDEEVEAGLTHRELLKIMTAALVGRTNGVGTTTEEFLSVDGSKARVTTTFDVTNNRVTVVLDGQ